MKAARFDKGMRSKFTLSELAERLDRPSLIIRALMDRYGLPALDGRAYGIAHYRFVKRLLGLKLLSIPEEKLLRLFEFEKKLVQMLRGDHPESATWMIDGWAHRGAPRCRLLLTQFDAGCDLRMFQVQPQLAFNEKPLELFESSDMGEHLEPLLRRYVKLRDEVVEKAVEEERRIRATLRGVVPGLKVLL
ncbi:MAG: hypothetical protein U1F77_05780 [Kiritimatiellia bacterium]